MYDGHKSHISTGLIERAKQNHIILFVLHPHCSHLLQPLDVSCYGPFEATWNAACHTYLKETGGNSITRFDVCKQASKVYTAALTSINIQAIFKKFGIYPFDSTVISDSAVAPSLSFARPTPVAPADNQSSSATEKTRGPDITTSASTSSTASGVNLLDARGGEILKKVKYSQ